MADLRKGICAGCPGFYCPQGAVAATCMNCFRNRADPWVWSIVRGGGRGKTTYAEDYLNFWRYGVSGGHWWRWMPGYFGKYPDKPSVLPSGIYDHLNKEDPQLKWLCEGGPCNSPVGVLARIKFDCD